MDLVRGMNAGADEYIVKSYETEELEVYIRAGVRILNLEQTLEEKSKRLNKVNCKLNLAFEQTRSDLIAASEIQKCLLPKPQTLENFRFEWIFSPCSYVAGDIFNYFILDENRLVFTCWMFPGMGYQIRCYLYP